MDRKDREALRRNAEQAQEAHLDPFDVAEDIHAFVELWWGSIPQEDGRTDDWIEANAALCVLNAKREEHHARAVKYGEGSGGPNAKAAKVRREYALLLARKHCADETNVSRAARRVHTQWAKAGLTPPAVDTIRNYLKTNRESWAAAFSAQNDPANLSPRTETGGSDARTQGRHDPSSRPRGSAT
ncbi:hypothetical protein [Alloyangia pacifica]|uniref:Uncharacterized protein n=1 Tax=Alloyangia pacifica TaxID=311180 RepID=A0A1I6PQI9_9RHOB|nr:hypothetical protein [Alloyangia pacifica]SDG33302.1 hypothetical protein SAMN04488245_102399 [Alloyangia pacifica]SFS42454.1 hypothetical protein SAMN04488050_101700 [Alloyangia pacifica]